MSVAKAYEINASRVDNENQLSDGMAKLWENPEEPYLLEVMIDIHTNVYPKMLFGNPITDMESE